MAVRNKSGLRRWAGLMVGGLSLLATCGCPPSPDLVIGPGGTVIRREYLTPILTNPDTTEEEKRQALRDLGITDESLIDLLIRTETPQTQGG